jgi:hypothetical protein
MLALVNTPNGKAPVDLRQTPEPALGLHEALVAVQAFSLNRGELRSFRNNEEGWIPGQDISGIVLRQAADGSGPPAGARIVALMDEFGWAERAAVPTLLGGAVSAGRFRRPSQLLRLLDGQRRALYVIDPLDLDVMDRVPMRAALNPTIEIGDFVEKHFDINQASVGSVLHECLPAREAAVCFSGHCWSPSMSAEIKKHTEPKAYGGLCA